MFTRVAICLCLMPVLLLPHSAAADSGDTESLLQRAEAGDPFAQYELGENYRRGRYGCPIDDDKAEEWYTKAVQGFQKAAETGDAKAQFMYAECLFYGNGLKYNRELAFDWYLKAAEAGNPEAQMEIAGCYFYGNRVEENHEKGIEWLRKAAAQGYADAQKRLGEIYAEGDFARKDFETSKEWYKRAMESYRGAADKGDLKALDSLAWLYYNGNGVDKDIEKALELFSKAAESGYLESSNNLAWHYHRHDKSRDMEKAIYWHKRSTEIGDVWACYWIGELYAHHIEPSDRDHAIEWYRKGAELGHPFAHIEWGKQLLNGTDEEIALAIDVLKDCIKKHEEYAGAHTELGKCYESGIGVEQNYAKAIELYEIAVEKSYWREGGEAMYRLGYMHEHGLGVTANEEKAEAWYYKAADRGSEEARNELGYAYTFYRVRQGINEFVRDYIW